MALESWNQHTRKMHCSLATIVESTECEKLPRTFERSENLWDPDVATKALYPIPRLCISPRARPNSGARQMTALLDNHGVTSASPVKVLHRLVGLNLDHVVNATKQHAEKNGRKGALPTIYIDASWLGRHVGGGAEGPVVRSTRVVGCLKNRGFNVFVVFDPNYRHHSKCASIDRCGVREVCSHHSLWSKGRNDDGFSVDARRNKNSPRERRVLAA